ncbi:hypothetical protein EBR66_08280 [bacterium]|nr:hypothetical protein [bacterium]
MRTRKIVKFPARHNADGLLQNLFDALDKFSEASRALDEVLMNLPRDVKEMPIGKIGEGGEINEGDGEEITLAMLVDLAREAEGNVSVELRPTVDALVKAKLRG